MRAVSARALLAWQEPPSFAARQKLGEDESGFAAAVERGQRGRALRRRGEDRQRSFDHRNQPIHGHPSMGPPAALGAGPAQSPPLGAPGDPRGERGGASANPDIKEKEE